MKITKTAFGKNKSGEDVYCYKLENSKGNYAEVLNYGATIRSIVIRDKNNNMKDVCLGYSTIEEYENNSGHFGGFIGRVGNRIGKGEFSIGDKTYKLAINSKSNHIHGGLKGFDKCMFNVSQDSEKIVFSRISEDMEEGYPGRLDLKVEYSFDDDNSFKIHYNAVSDKDTIVNFTNHSYFNLDGESSGDILDTTMQIFSSFYTVNDDENLPTGEIFKTKNTVFDFSVPKKIGKDIKDKALEGVGGYDHNYIIDGYGFRKAAIAKSEKSGISLEVMTDKPGMQFYTGNGIKPSKGKGGTEYAKYSGFCLETQYFPDGISYPHFVFPILKKGELYDYTTVYKFSV